ncbi:MAG: thioredoxin domain-containing protein [Patescibacteria group bacterium]|nr:thioredoxin domain-containing protein [Patescibacteria group bacterium]
MSKQFWGVIILVILALVGIGVVTSKKDAATNTSSASANTATTHTLGKGAKHVTLVEYGDFQCPFCGQYYPTVKQVTDTYKDDITFQFRHFPLTSLHQNAFAASRAAEAAGKQGKFFEMFDALYQSQTQWSSSNAPQSTFEQYASLLKLDVAKFKLDYASSAVNDAINADMAAGNKLGITGTPTFFLDGKQVTIANTVAAFKKAIDTEISKKNPASTTTTTSPSSASTDSMAPATSSTDGAAATNPAN